MNLRTHLLQSIPPQIYLTIPKWDNKELSMTARKAQGRGWKTVHISSNLIRIRIHAAVMWRIRAMVVRHRKHRKILRVHLLQFTYQISIMTHWDWTYLLILKINPIVTPQARHYHPRLRNRRYKAILENCKRFQNIKNNIQTWNQFASNQLIIWKIKRNKLKVRLLSEKEMLRSMKIMIIYQVQNFQKRLPASIN